MKAACFGNRNLLGREGRGECRGNSASDLRTALDRRERKSSLGAYAGLVCEGDYKFEDVLTVAKLWQRDGDVSTFLDLLGKKPRPLLTPPLLWTGLATVAADFPDSRIVTLSGYDERPLWNAWWDCSRRTLPVGHLYVPELTERSDGNRERAVHMARPGTQLDWTSDQDIRKRFQPPLPVTTGTCLSD